MVIKFNFWIKNIVGGAINAQIFNLFKLQQVAFWNLCSIVHDSRLQRKKEKIL